MNPSPQILRGIRVLELGEYMSAAFCARLLGDYGAEVIKVEPPSGDLARRHGPFPQDPHPAPSPADGRGKNDPERSGLFLYLNQGKLGVTADLATPDDRALVLGLARVADVVVHNYRPCDLERLGLTHDVLARENPAAVLVAVTPFGQDGPYANYKSYAINTAAFAGAAHRIGSPDRYPLTMPLQRAEYWGGMNGAAAAMVGLLARRRFGIGQVADVAASEAIHTFTNGFDTILYVDSGAITSRRGIRTAMSYPYTVLPCKDGYFAMIIANHHHWQRWVELMGSPEWSKQPRYQDRAAMGHIYPEEVDALIKPFLAQHTKRELWKMCRDNGIPWHAVQTIDEVLAWEQLQYRGYWQRVPDGDGAAWAVPGSQARLTSTPSRATGPAPRLGQHNNAVYDDLLGGTAPKPAAANRSLPLTPSHKGREEKSRRQALEGYRIVDLTQVWAGPQLCATLGDFGAEVIRVESASSTDQARLATAGKSEFRRSLEMQRHPRNREYFVTLNLGTAEGNALFREIVSTADIFVCNLSPRVMEKMRIRYEDLRPVRPDIIVVTISAAGKDGPFKDLMAFGPTFNAFIGHDSLVGYPETGELMSAYWDPDATMGVMGCYAAMLAIWHREATGAGQHVDLSFSELLAGFLGEAALEYQMTGKVPGPQGNRHPLFAPHGIYPCAGDDAWVSITVATDDEWHALAAAMGQSSLASDLRFATAAVRLEHRDELDRMLAQWTRPQANSAVMHLLQSVGVAATPAASIAETYDDPHHTFRRQRADILTSEVANEDLLFGFPWRMSATPGTIRRLGQPVGHDNARFYPEMLGMSRSRFADLTQRKVLA